MERQLFFIQEILICHSWENRRQKLCLFQLHNFSYAMCSCPWREKQTFPAQNKISHFNKCSLDCHYIKSKKQQCPSKAPLTLKNLKQQSISKTNDPAYFCLRQSDLIMWLCCWVSYTVLWITILDLKRNYYR